MISIKTTEEIELYEKLDEVRKNNISKALRT